MMRALMSIHVHTGQLCGRERRIGSRFGGTNRKYAAQYLPFFLNIHSYPLLVKNTNTKNSSSATS